MIEIWNGQIKPTKTTAAAPMPEQKIANLALQGGGTHGAFTWGFCNACSRSPGFR